MRSPLVAPLLALALGATAGPALAQGHSLVEAVRVDEAQADGRAQIRIETSAAPDFNLIRLVNPTRLVVDLAGADVSSAAVPTTFQDDGLVSNVTTTRFRSRDGVIGRVVVVLRGEVRFDAKAVGNAVVIEAEREAAGEGAGVIESAPAPAKASTATTPIIELEGEAEPLTDARRMLGVQARERDGRAVVAIRADGSLPRYEIEEVTDPDRLVVDLYGLAAIEPLDEALSLPGLKKVRAFTHPDKTRVVLVADGALPLYDVASTDEGLTLLFEPPSASRAVGPVSTLEGVTFDEKSGFYRLGLEVSGAVAVRTVANGPRRKTIAIDGVAASAEHLRDHPFVGGPVGGVRLEADPNKPNSVRVSLALDGEVEHSVWQKEGRVFWDVRRKASPVASSDRVQPRAAAHTQAALAATSAAASRRYRGRKITIDLMSADIINVLRLLGDVSGKNVVVGEDVKGTISIKLKNVPWDQALDVILRTKGLGKETRGGIIRIAPQSRLDAEQAARLKLQEEVRTKRPTTVRLIPVNYAVARELVNQIKQLLSERGRATFDERTNVIIVEDIRENLDQAEQLVRTLDTQTPQVLIEARMVEAGSDFSRALGIQWGGGLFFSQRGGNPTGLVFPNNVGIVGGADSQQALLQPQPGVFFPSNFAVNLPAASTNSAVGMNLGAIGNFGFLNARLSAAETTGEVKIISAPKITTLNNKPASIKQGVEFAFPVVTQNVVNFQVVQANLQLDVTPHVTADGSVLMQLLITNNIPNFNQRVGAVPTFQTKEARTEMLVKDGDTAVIGGIYTRNTGSRVEQTPFLGSIPIIGWLFKNQSLTEARTELLVFITPRIVNRRGSGGF